MHKTNRIHLAVCARVYPDNTKGTSKRGKNISHATRRPSARNVLPCLIFTTFSRHLCVHTDGQMEPIC